MKQELKTLIWKECNVANNFLKIPGIYRHFKEIKDEEDMIYAVTNISMPIVNELAFMAIFSHEKAEYIPFTHTELEEEVYVIRIGDRYYHHHTVDAEKLVIYTALYADRKTYVRPLTMFLSKVDKEKYPHTTQKFRFESI